MAGRALDWLELITGLTCNCRCVVCPSAYLGRTEPMSIEEMEGALRTAREEGANNVWFGGGEPTLHPQLPAAVRCARALGYRRVRVQTNGLRLAYAAYTKQLAALGVTEVALAVMGGTAAAHDAVTHTPGSFELLLAGAAEARRVGLELYADILVTTRSNEALVTAVDALASLGLAGVSFWWMSLHGLDVARLSSWLPSMSASIPELARALARAETLGAEAVTLHTPPCVLPAALRRHYVHAGRWNLAVALPGGERFRAETSPMEGGTYLAGCAGCRARADCLGLRPDYLAVHGDREFVPVVDERA
jgi:hypothetical protein